MILFLQNYGNKNNYWNWILYGKCDGALDHYDLFWGHNAPLWVYMRKKSKKYVKIVVQLELSWPSYFFIWNWMFVSSVTNGNCFNPIRGARKPRNGPKKFLTIQKWLSSQVYRRKIFDRFHNLITDDNTDVILNSYLMGPNGLQG